MDDQFFNLSPKLFVTSKDWKLFWSERRSQNQKKMTQRSLFKFTYFFKTPLRGESG